MTRIAHYRILEKIGEGAMGVVFLAEDMRLDRRVALKVLVHEKPDGSRGKRFEREAKAIAALNHPNILSIYDYGREGDQPYIAMELLDGRTLRQVLDEGALPLRKALGYGLEIVEGLAAAHDKGISHRDLKPANVFITRDDRVKILDFGLAAVRQPVIPDSPAGETVLLRDSPTTPGMVLGTIGYMAPEQVRGEPADHRADIFAFGAVLYELLAGERAFADATAVETMHAILVRPPAFEKLERGSTPEPVMHILRRCLEKRPEQRFQSARDLAFALQTLLAQPALGSHPSAAQWRESHSGISPSSPSAAMSAYRAIAVLPFSNLSSDPDMEYFSDGVTEEIINALAQVPALRVAARTSSFAFKGKAVNLADIATRLKVDSILEGSVRRAGKRLRITAQLINVADGYQMWAERYDRDLDDVFAIQDDIATNIARKLQLSLGATDQLVRPATGYMDAYDLYLQGRFFVEQRGAGLAKGLTLFQEALARDPRFALTHAAVAEVMTLLAIYVIGDPAERMQHAERAATLALELDPNLAEAHNSMAVVKMLWHWDWAGALAEFDRALEINPNHVHARFWKGLFYHQWCRGDHDAALRETRRAVELDPISTIPLYAEALVLVGMGRYDDAARRASHGLERDPNSFLLHRIVGVALLGQQRPQEAIPHIEKATAFSQRSPVMLAELAVAYLAAGQHGHAEQVQQELTARGKSTYVSPTSLAMLASARGDLEEGLTWLRRAFERRDPQLLAVLVWPSTARLMQDARVRELYRRIGIDWIG
jgi:serine/threonine-protein kinase